jgi:hypothetical protein
MLRNKRMIQKNRANTITAMLVIEKEDSQSKAPRILHTITNTIKILVVLAPAIAGEIFQWCITSPIIIFFPITYNP